MTLTSNVFNVHFNDLMNAIIAIIDKHALMQKISRKKQIYLNPWLTKGLLISIKHKQKLYRTHFLNGDSTDVFTRNTQISSLELKTLSKKMYFNNAVDERKNKSKDVRKFINSVIPHKHCKNPSPPKLIKDGKDLQNHEEISEESNNYFSKIGLTIAIFANSRGSNDIKN